MKKIVWVVVLVAVALAVFIYVKKPANQWSSPNEVLASPTPIPSVKVYKKAVPKTGGESVGQSMPYSQLVAKYAPRRIQFDERCQAIPGSPTYKNNISVMFDNRSGDARYIKIGDVIYLFGGYDYKILTLSSSTLPKTLTMDCGSAVNVGTILLQK